MLDYRPRLIVELRPAVLNFLHQVYFETSITIFLGLMDEPVFKTPEFGDVFAYSRKMNSLDYDVICHALAEEIGLDIIKLEKEGGHTKYGFYLYQVPSKEYPTLIRYAKQFG